MNNIVNQEDKRGGLPYPSWLINGFQEVLEDCDLNDVELIGYPYTWERGHGTSEWMESRLDRALVNRSMLESFADIRLTNLEISTSDHNPIYLEPKVLIPFTPTRSFKFENAWLREPICRQIVEDIWDRHQGDSLQNKLRECAVVLSKWGQEVTGSFKDRIMKCKAMLKRFKGRRDSNSIKKYQEALDRLNEIYCQQEVFWRQRSKQLWLREGDQNSKFFHAASKNRRRANKITSLFNDAGEEVDWDSGLDHTMSSYFSNLFSSSGTEWNPLLEGVRHRIDDVQNTSLTSPVETNEVKKALFSMHPDKSPGPDGISPGFYQKFWGIVGKDLVQITRDFFITGQLQDGIGDTIIVLIPKKKSPVNMRDLRPISLCNVSYKVISKVIANRLKMVLPHLISEIQSAFIPGRLITDNIMVSYEVIHYMKRKTQGTAGWMALKLDMSKAYDRVEWSFLRRMLTQMSFNLSSINLMMTCVCSAKYQISNSGRQFGSIIPSRGIRQGDPLSSYLFLVCMEGLSILIQEYERRRNITGIQVARGAPRLSHMFFADDTYLFCKASEREVDHIVDLLNIFELSSSQKINAEKSSVLFSRNVAGEIRGMVCSKLGFSEAGDNTLYLGLPNMIGRNKSRVLGYVKDRMKERIKGWEKNFLSRGGKEILLKTVA